MLLPIANKQAILDRTPKTEITAYGASLVGELLTAMINLEHVHLMRQQQNTVDLNEFFRQIDVRRVGYLTRDDLKRVMQCDGDVDLLVCWLNKYKGSGRVTQFEFLDKLQP